MVWGDGTPLTLTLDSYELWDLRRKPIDHATYNYATMKRLLEEGDAAKVYATFGQDFEKGGTVPGVGKSLYRGSRIWH